MGDLALEHSKLMAQHEDLGVLRDSVHPMKRIASSTRWTRR
jgi:hypothetical protein